MSDTPQFLRREFDALVKAAEIEDAPALQLREHRRMFMAGARAYSSILFSIAGDQPPEVAATETDIAVMEALEVELEVFLDDVLNGRA